MPSYKKENGTYYCAFYYTDWNGKKKKKKKEGFKKQKDAKQYEIDFLNKMVTNSDITFENLFKNYMEDCKTRIRPTTYQGKEYILKVQILPFFKDYPISKIEPAIVRKWQNNLLSKNYSETYIKTLNNQLSAIFNFAVKYYKLERNPLAITGSIGKKHADSMKFWTVDQFKKFIVAVEDKIMSKVAFNVLFWTGIRSGELLALTLNDIDLDNKTISINKTFHRLEGKDYISDPKTQKSKRIVTIPDFLCEMIKDYVDKLYDYENEMRLFFATKYYLNHEMKRGCKKSGVEKIRVHDLRHSHASLLIEMGFSPLLISERLGHDNIETTLSTYSHLYPNKHSEVAEKLNSFRN